MDIPNTEKLLIEKVSNVKHEDSLMLNDKTDIESLSKNSINEKEITQNENEKDVVWKRVKGSRRKLKELFKFWR